LHLKVLIASKPKQSIIAYKLLMSTRMSLNMRDPTPTIVDHPIADGAGAGAGAIAAGADAGADGSAVGSSTSMPMSDVEFEIWLLENFVRSHAPLYACYREVFRSATQAITRWRQRYHGDAALWKRLFDVDRVRKEFVEAVPIIDAVITLVENANDVDQDDATNKHKFTIVDMASGKGEPCYLY
jgi:hypothetical protein